MRKFLFLFAAAIIVTSCNSVKKKTDNTDDTEETTKKKKTTDDDMTTDDPHEPTPADDVTADTPTDAAAEPDDAVHRGPLKRRLPFELQAEFGEKRLRATVGDDVRRLVSDLRPPARS